TCLRTGLGATSGPTTTYRIIIVARLASLAQSWNSRIFQNESAPDIVKRVLGDHDLKKVADRLIATYLPREYCVQYQETALAFVTRLVEDEGFFFFTELDDEG